MESFNIKGLEAWENVKPKEIRVFKVTPGQRRNVRLTVNCTEPVAVYAADDKSMAGRKLVGCAVGLFEVSFSTGKDAFVEFDAVAGTAIFVRGHTADQTVKAGETAKYTTPEPRGRRSPEMDQMLRLLRQNEKTRQAQYQRELAALRKEFGANAKPDPVIDDEPQPDPKPKAKKGKTDEGSEKDNSAAAE